ncbi:MAG: iron ABC transporter permease [Spirochaetes bacterium]|uniref:Iron ABC transporter permease n=1 Tax=Candidatus Ornithospirochaeta stercoripullorum TaxID=2840899 RepID=A0A9D9E1D1_9SPIO|nr:iron ABC transporter permease [Candidatus Ornithospirochaeta stercoripullorum]
MRNDRAFPRAIALLVSVLLFLFFVSLLIGSSRIKLGNIFTSGSSDNIIFFSIRLPRATAAALAGFAFSLSGLLLQSATGNDLASPNIIGMNSGAGCAVLLFLSCFPSLFMFLPLVAFVGGMLALLLVFSIASLVSTRTSSSALILAGIAVNALFNAVISTISSLDPDVMSSYSAFSVGGFASVQASSLIVPSIIIAFSSVAVFSSAHLMDTIKLGDEIASSMGYNPRAIRIMLSSFAALLAASAVSFSGLLGFVGLVTPHLAEYITAGRSCRKALVTVLAGMDLVLIADLLARTVIMPGELPAGIFMAAVGVPFFIFLVVRRAKL